MKRIILIITVAALFLPILATDIVILHTNDIMNVFQARGATFINPDFPPMLGGVYSFATAVQWERADALKDGDIMLLFDSGNFSMKHIAEDSVTMDRAIEMFNYLKYDAVNLGIDELSSGFGYIERNLPRFNMPVLLSNIRPDSGFESLDLKEYVIFERKGVRIGVFGLTTEYAVFDLRKHVLETVSIEREIGKAREIVDILKSNKCDIIIGITSIGFDHDMKLAAAVPGIDVIFGGYEGRGMRSPVEHPQNHTIIFKGYGELSSYEKIVLHLNDLNNIEDYTSESVTLFEEAFPPDPELEKILESTEL